MRNPFRSIDKKLKEKYWYSESLYQYVKCGVVGWGVTIILYITWFINGGFH